MEINDQMMPRRPANQVNALNQNSGDLASSAISFGLDGVPVDS